MVRSTRPDQIPQRLTDTPTKSGSKNGFAMDPAPSRHSHLKAGLYRHSEPETRVQTGSKTKSHQKRVRKWPSYALLTNIVDNMESMLYSRIGGR